MPTVYCSHADVSALKGRAAYTESSVPKASQVDSIIDAVQDEIDRYTNSAWRIKTIINEYHDYRGPRLGGFPVGYGSWLYDVKDRRTSYFRYKPVLQIDGTKGDKIEILRGNTYEDLVATGQEGRDKDFWIEYDRGELFLVTTYPARERNSIRLSYRYGNSGNVPNDIRLAATLLTAAYLASGTVGTFLTPEGGSEPGYETRWRTWRSDAYEILDRYYDLRIDNL